MIYNAFISYRHAELDMEIAKWIHGGLESFRIPSAIQKKCGKKNIKRVFRDQEELPIGSDLDDNISKALQESEYLIVICSPRTRESYWVCKEIETFIQMHDRQHVLAVLIEGEPNESFPEMLLKDENGEPVEPLAADVRGADRRERRTKFKTEIIRLAAPLIGCTFDDLKQRHRERKIKQMCTIVSSIFLFLAVLGAGFAVYNAQMAAKIDKNYKKAIENQYKYMADNALSLYEEGYRKDAVLVAYEALSDADGDMPYVPQAEYVLSEALYTYDSGNTLEKDDMLEHAKPVDVIKYDADGCHLLSVDRDNRVYVWDVQNNNSLACTAREQDPATGEGERILDFNHVGDELVVCTPVEIVGFSLSGQKNWFNEIDKCDCAALSVKDSIVVTTSADKINVFDIASHKVTKTYTPSVEGATYSSYLSYSDDCGLILTSLSSSDGKGYVEVIDANKGEVHTITLKGDMLSTLNCSADGSLCTVSYSMDAVLDDISKPYPVEIQMFDVTNGDVKWSYSTENAESTVGTSAGTIVKSRSYTDSLGEEHKDTMVSMNNRIICFDSETGAVVSEYAMSGAVHSLLLSTAGPLGYAALSNGRIEVLNFATGEIYASNSIDTKQSLVDLKVSGGVFAIRSFSSSDVMLLKFHTGSNLKQILEGEDTITSTCASPNGAMIAVLTKETGDKLCFVSSEATENADATPVCYDITAEGYDTLQSACFVDDNMFFICDNNGKYAFIKPDTLEARNGEISYKVNKQSGINLNSAGTHAVAYSTGELVLMDLEDESIAGQWTTDESATMDDCVIDAQITNSADKIYFVGAKSGLSVLDVKSGNISAISDELNNVCNSILINQVLALSNNGKYVAVSCTDGMLKLYDLEEKKIRKELEYTGYNSSYISFIDDSRLLVQGDDYYISIFDVATGDRLYTSKYQYDPVKMVTILNESGRLVIKTNNDMLVLEPEGYVMVADINEGSCATSQGKIITKNVGNLYATPFQTISSLKEDASKQYENEALSADKRLKYHMNFAE